MQTTVFYTSDNLEKDAIIPLYIKNKDKQRELRLCRVISKNKEASQGNCACYVLKVL